MIVARQIVCGMVLCAGIVWALVASGFQADAAEGRQADQPAKQTQTKQAKRSGAAGKSAAKKDGKAASKKPQQTDAGPARYTTSKKHDPNGIGKFYMEREIAHVMGYLAIPWLERPTREDEEQPSKLVQSLGLKPGMVVADIGAGSGVLTLMMAGLVAPEGRILAVDVQQEMLDRLSGKCRLLGVTNVEPVLGTEKSPRLKANSVDLALMVDVYHEFAFPYEMMVEIAAAMKPGGRIVFVEYRREDPNVRRQIKLVHTMTEEQVKKEILLPEFQLKHTDTVGVLPMQHIIVFTRIDARQGTTTTPKLGSPKK